MDPEPPPGTAAMAKCSSLLSHQVTASPVDYMKAGAAVSPSPSIHLDFESFVNRQRTEQPRWD